MADPERQLIIQLNLAEDVIRERFEEVVAYLREQNTLSEIERMLEDGRADEALRMIDRAAAYLAEASALSFVSSGQATAAVIEGSLGSGASVTFEIPNERAIRYLRETRLELIREFTDQQREAVREALVEGSLRGLNPRDQARMVRSSIGLTHEQLRYVNNYRRALETGDAGNALSRELRDRRHDRRIARIATDPLTRQEIDARVDAYHRRWIEFRAETIARTEALRSVHAGADEAWWQAIESGDVDPADVECEWNISGGVVARGRRKGKSRTRDSHRAMSGQRQPFGTPFISGYGNLLRYPCDPNAPVSETANCRCRKITRLRA